MLSAFQNRLVPVIQRGLVGIYWGLMMRLVLALFLVVLPLATPVWSEGRTTLGVGRIFTNDIFGDGADRWRTGSYAYSLVRGRDAYSGTEDFGDLISYRLQAQIIAPSRQGGAPGDRPYVGSVSLGASTHFGYAGTQVSLGGDIEAIGPQTGMSDFQESFHDTFDMPAPRFTDQQLGDTVFLNGMASATRSVQTSRLTTLRPFIEARIGGEDLLRVGADVIFGNVAQNDLLLRDVVTGQLYRGTESTALGFSYVVGADFATVFDSVYLPGDMGYTVSQSRARARTGVHWQIGDAVSFFYGATYLSPEFVGQADGQVVGSVKLNFNF